MITRRNLIWLALSAASTRLLGCMSSARGDKGDGDGVSMDENLLTDTKVTSLEEAVRLSCEVLSERYGEGFRWLKGLRDYATDVGDGRFRYTFTLACDYDESRAFSASVLKQAGTDLAYSRSFFDNYQQWVFKPLVEGPFEEALAGVSGIEGYAVTLFCNRMDARVWSADELDEYMSDKPGADPMVDVVLMLPPDDSLEAMARAIRAAYEALWPLETDMQLCAGRAGTNPYEDALHRTDVTKLYAATRGAVPTIGEIEHSLKWDFDREPTTSWDGTGEPGDPERVLPQITWAGER